METFHLYHLAKCWSGGQPGRAVPAIPLTTGPVRPATSKTPPVGEATLERPLAGKDTVIRAAAVHLVYASRLSQGFITPSEVNTLEDWTGLVCQHQYLHNPISKPTQLGLVFYYPGCPDCASEYGDSVGREWTQRGLCS